jgi:Protein of unknown function (DUF998)
MRVLASCGIAGPVVFTAAWVASSLLQTGHPVTEVQLSGLAAMDARDPQIMMAGFIGLGVCSVAFGAAVGRVTPRGSAGPWLVMSAGMATVVAGLFRRDHVLLVGPGFTGESWHNQVHDLVSGAAYVAMIAAPLVLARNFRRDPDLAGLRRPLQALALVSAAALALFASGAVAPWDGTVQRVAVTLPLAAEALIAARLLATSARRARSGSVLGYAAPGGDHYRGRRRPGGAGRAGQPGLPPGADARRGRGSGQR